MAKITDMTGGMQGQPPQQQMQVDVSQSTPMKCECGHDVFIPGTKFRKISKLLTGTPQDMLIPVEVYLCGECGQINKELYPKELQSLDE